MTEKKSNAILFWRSKTQAAVAQVVAHLIGSEEVTGSIPVISFKKTSELSEVFSLPIFINATVL